MVCPMMMMSCHNVQGHASDDVCPHSESIHDSDYRRLSSVFRSALQILTVCLICITQISHSSSQTPSDNGSTGQRCQYSSSEGVWLCKANTFYQLSYDQMGYDGSRGLPYWHPPQTISFIATIQ